MKSLRGADDQMTVASFKEFPISILWEPSQLKDCPNLSSSVNTMEFMFNLQQAVKSILEEREMEDKESICWQLSLQHLWLQVNRFAQSFNWRPPPKDEEDVNVHCINLMKVLAHLPEEEQEEEDSSDQEEEKESDGSQADPAQESDKEEENGKEGSGHGGASSRAKRLERKNKRKSSKNKKNISEKKKRHREPLRIFW